MDSYIPENITLILKYEEFLYIKQIVEAHAKNAEKCHDNAQKNKPRLKIINPTALSP